MTTGAWPAERVPRATVEAVREELGPLVDDVLAAVRRENPVYAPVFEGSEGVALRLGVEQAVSSFLTAVQRGEHPGRDTAELWRRLGEAEFQAGRSLEALRGAFRTGIRAAWRGAAEVAVRAGLSPDMVISLAEAIFVYSDELATDVVEGYVRVQSDEAGERERRRRRLAMLILDAVAHDSEAIERASELARWPLPRTVGAVALASSGARSHPDALAGSDAGGAWMLIGDPQAPGREAELRRTLDGALSALGPTVPLREAHRSLRWARQTLRLVERGVLPAGAPVPAREHLGALLVHGDEALADMLARERLAALEGLVPAERDRLLETLEGWLAHQRHVPKVADALHVHPQTVRYRLVRLRDLLGDALESPDRRFELELALRARRRDGARG